MNSSFAFPIVSYQDIIDLFHSILFWRYEQKSSQGISPNHWYLTFDTVWNLLEMSQVLPKKRIQNLRGKRELCALLLKRTLVIEIYDERTWKSLFADAGFKHFCIRKGNRELTRGNTVNPLELFSRTHVYITRFGVREASASVDRVSHLLYHDQFLTVWNKYTAPIRPAEVLGALMKERNRGLDEEIWGIKPNPVGEEV